MRRLVVFLLVATVVSVASAQTDYGGATHWASALLIGEDLRSPVILGDVVLVADGSPTIHRIDISDPYAPEVLAPLLVSGPVLKLLGPHAGYLYAAGPEHLRVLEVAGLTEVAVLDLANVRDMGFGEGFGAILLEDGERLAVVDLNQPTDLPELGSLNLFAGDDQRFVAIHGDHILLAGDWLSECECIDASDPASPTIVSYFGWTSSWKRGEAQVQKTIWTTRQSIRVVVIGGTVYTVEYQERGTPVGLPIGSAGSRGSPAGISPTPVIRLLSIGSSQREIDAGPFHLTSS